MTRPIHEISDYELEMLIMSLKYSKCTIRVTHEDGSIEAILKNIPHIFSREDLGFLAKARQRTRCAFKLSKRQRKWLEDIYNRLQSYHPTDGDYAKR